MNIGDLLSGLLKPAGDAIDKITTNDEERGKLKLALIDRQIKLVENVIDAQVKAYTARANIILADQSGNGIKSTWRPWTAVTIVGMTAYKIMLEPFLASATAWLFEAQLPTVSIPEWLGTALLVMVGGYAGARSIEKIVDKLGMNSLLGVKASIFDSRKTRKALARLEQENG